MTRSNFPGALLLASLAAPLSWGYAAAQDADKNPWMAEVAKAAADGRCEEAKTIALRNGSIDVAERALKLCTPPKAAPPAVQPVQAPPKAVAPVKQAQQAQQAQQPVTEKAPEPVPTPVKAAAAPPPVTQTAKIAPVAAEAPSTLSTATPSNQATVNPDWRRRPTIKEMEKFFPKAAIKQKMGGIAILECSVNTLGLLEGCEVFAEAPLGLGFGEAALKLAPLFEMTPRLVNGVATNGSVNIPITFVGRAGWAPPPSFPLPNDRNYSAEVRRYRQAAEQGDASAQRNLGLMYNNGQGVPKDYATAFRKAADQGQPKAQNNLKALCATSPTTTGCPYP